MRRILVCLLALHCPLLWAHEFWMMPQTFSPAAGSAVRLTLHVGENFEGNLVGFSAGHAAALRHHAQGKTEDLHDRLPRAAAWPEFRLPPLRSGAHVVDYDSVPSNITLSADKFHAYLHEEGLEAVIRQREAAGMADKPGRERYRRCVKTLLHAGGKTDATALMRTGQRLEILPLVDPHTKGVGEVLRFKVLFDNQPLAGALVKAWHKHEGPLVVIRARTGADGQISLSLPYTGTWMVSVVHMIAVTDSREFDWESFWGNLTFELPRRR